MCSTTGLLVEANELLKMKNTVILLEQNCPQRMKVMFKK